MINEWMIQNLHKFADQSDDVDDDDEQRYSGIFVWMSFFMRLLEKTTTAT